MASDPGQVGGPSPEDEHRQRLACGGVVLLIAVAVTVAALGDCGGGKVSQVPIRSAPSSDAMRLAEEAQRAEEQRRARAEEQRRARAEIDRSAEATRRAEAQRRAAAAARWQAEEARSAREKPGQIARNTFARVSWWIRSDLTRVQLSANWAWLRGQWVRWTGTVEEVRPTYFGEHVEVSLYMRTWSGFGDRSATFTFRATEAQGLRLRKGGRVTVEGRLSSGLELTEARIIAYD